MSDRKHLAREGLRSALSLRHSQHIPPNRPVQVYDLVDALNIDLWFVDAPSMEGLYYKASRPAILISALRPKGRRSFTCAHELGHHVFRHGTVADELVLSSEQTNTFDPNEFLVDSFASALLMPKAAVDWAFRSRGWVPEECTPQQIYVIAGWFDVGYETLIQQLSRSLNMVSPVKAKSLLRYTPSRVRSEFLGTSHDGDLVIVDDHWLDRAIDIEVGDLIALPGSITIDGSNIAEAGLHGTGTLVRAINPGIGRVISSDGAWAAFVRVSRKGFTGRSIFRHLEEPTDDE